MSGQAAELAHRPPRIVSQYRCNRTHRLKVLLGERDGGGDRSYEVLFSRLKTSSTCLRFGVLTSDFN
jgi:hypothetical protein